MKRQLKLKYLLKFAFIPYLQSLLLFPCPRFRAFAFSKWELVWVKSEPKIKDSQKKGWFLILPSVFIYNHTFCTLAHILGHLFYLDGITLWVKLEAQIKRQLFLKLVLEFEQFLYLCQCLSFPCTNFRAIVLC